MALQFPPLATTHVGSMPRPRWMGHTERNRVTFRLEGKDLDQAQDDATIVTLREQEALGIDIVTDGRDGRRRQVCQDLHRPAGEDGARRADDGDR